ALCRQTTSGSGVARANLDVGAWEMEKIVLVEVDSEGRRRRTEFFAPRRLDDAIVRLYECYADLVPDGPEHVRAASIARSVAAVVEAFDLDRYATAFAPTIEAVDRRSVIGWGAVRGAEEVLRTLRALLEVAADLSTRIDHILALRPDRFLLRWTNSGTQRVGGGAYERQFLLLWIFGADGLVTRYELFDSDRDAEALARFDELTAAPPAARIENAATRNGERVRDAWAARDWERFAALFPAGFRMVDRRKLL